MRILFFSHYFPPEGNAPAARTYAHCRYWTAAGHDVTVITAAPNHPQGAVYPGYRNRLRQLERMDGIRVVRVGTYLAANKGLWKRSASWFSYLVSATFWSLFEPRPDVVIATSPHPFCGWAGVLASRWRRRPLLLEVRDLWPEAVAAVGALRSRLALKLVDWMVRGAYRAAAHIVTVGEGYRIALTGRGVDPGRISVIMNGVDGELFHPRQPDPALAARLGLGERFVVAYCGTIGMAHGLEVVLRAGAVLKERRRRDILFLLIGDGARLDPLRAAAAEAAIDNVIFTGQLDRREVPEVLACAHACLVHMRAAETFESVLPSKIFDGAALGLPYIAGVGEFARGFVEEAGCALCVEPGDPEGLADAAARLADDEALRRRLGDAGRAFVARFDRRRLAERYLRIIERTAGVAEGGTEGGTERALHDPGGRRQASSTSSVRGTR